MNIFIVAIGSQGDLYPLIGIGRTLAQKGHSVKILANDTFEVETRKAGLDFVPIGSRPEYNDFLENMEGTGIRRNICNHLYLKPMRPVYEHLASNHIPGRSMVICNISALGARLANEKLGLPMVSINLTPMMFFSVYDPPPFTITPYPAWLPRFAFRIARGWGYHLFDRDLAPTLNSYRKELGLQPVRRVLRWMLSPQKILCLFPDWFAAPQPDWPSQSELTGFPLFDEGCLPESTLPPELEEFLAAGEAPIIFTPGTPNKNFSTFFEKARRATEELGARAIFISKFKEQVPDDLPQNMRYFSYVPFSQVFCRASILVFHGGTGTMAQAFRAGLPQLVTPWGIDQYDNGARVKRLGLGDVIDAKRCTVQTLAQALAQLRASTETRKRCEAIACRIQQAQPMEDTIRIVEAAGASQVEKKLPGLQDDSSATV